MQMQMPELPHRVLNAILIVAIVHMAGTAGGGWMLYQFAMGRMDTNVERLTERIDRLGESVEQNSVLIGQLGERIDRNAELIRQNAERIERNGELITQLRERMTAVEVRVGGLEEVVRFFHPPESELRQ